MPEIERDKSIIEHIKNYCEEIEQTIKRFGSMDENLENDNDYKKSLAMSILQIGELETHLSENFKENNAVIPWKNIKAMRNIVAHGYGKIDWEIVNEVAKNDIPVLKRFCEEKLK